MWSIISDIDASPKKVNPKGITLLFFKCLNLLIDLIPNNIGITTAWKCAKNKIKKNKIIFPKLIHTKLIRKHFSNYRKREIYHCPIIKIIIVRTKGKAG